MPHGYLTHFQPVLMLCMISFDMIQDDMRIVDWCWKTDSFPREIRTKKINKDTVNKNRTKTEINVDKSMTTDFLNTTCLCLLCI